jgi:hypothetical protein
MERARPIRRSSRLRFFFPSISNFLWDQMVSKGLCFGACSFMATTLGPDLFLFFLVFLLALASLLAGFDSLAIPDLISEGVCACMVLRFWMKEQSFGFNRLVREREREARERRETRRERRENIFLI